MASKSLLLTTIYPPLTGGSGRWFWEIYRRLPRDRYVVIAGRHPNVAALHQEHGAETIRLPLELPEWGVLSPRVYLEYRKLSNRIVQLAQRNGCKAIHCGRLLPDGWIGRLAARRLRIPYAVYMHGEETAYADASRQLNWMGQRVLRDAAVAIANSKNTASLLINRWDADSERVKILNPGVDCTRFIPAERDEHARQQLRWHQRRVVLTVGRLQQRKGQDMMIRALPTIARSVPDVLYAIVGDGADYERLAALTRELGVEKFVRFHRDLNDQQLVQCYQQCDLFVLPNRAVGADIEGFGMVLLEAQACGKAVLAGASGGTAETMDIPASGKVIDCREPDDLAENVAAWLDDPHVLERMGDAGRRWVTAKFDWPALACQAAEVHEGLFESQAAT